MQQLCHDHDALFIVDDVTDNVFRMSGRINSTRGGNLADMVRACRILEVIESDAVFDRVEPLGKALPGCLQKLATAHPELVSNPRGRGLMCAFDLPTGPLRDEVVARMAAGERGLHPAIG